MSKVPKMDAGYPKLISEEFEGIPSRIDAALTWERNRNLYFFKGTQYWRFDYEAAKAGLRGLGDQYPMDISVFKGLPNNLDAASVWKNGKTYFFKGHNYYRMLERRIEVSASRINQRSSSFTW